MLCAYLSAALFVGLGANTLFGPWWTDLVTTLLIAGVALNEGGELWREETCAPCRYFTMTVA
jgi:divalent metal cation (Fe/Co/Zn/Cd) transporter